jgi:hypothetical protein
MQHCSVVVLTMPCFLLATTAMLGAADSSCLLPDNFATAVCELPAASLWNVCLNLLLLMLC